MTDGSETEEDMHLGDTKHTPKRAKMSTTPVANSIMVRAPLPTMSLQAFQDAANAYETVVAQNQHLQGEVQRLTEIIAEHNNVRLKQDIEQHFKNAKLPGDVKICASPQDIHTLMNACQGFTTTTRLDGTISVHIHGNNNIHKAPEIVSFAKQHVQHPRNKGDRAIVLMGPKRGRFVVVMGITDDTAIVKVERSTQKELDKLFDDNQDEECTLFPEEWNTGDLKAGVPLLMLGVRMI